MLEKRDEEGQRQKKTRLNNQFQKINLQFTILNAMLRNQNDEIQYSKFFFVVSPENK